MTLIHHHGSDCDCSRCRRERLSRGTQKLATAIALRGGQIQKSIFVANWEPYCDDPVGMFRIITSRQAVDELKAMEVSFKVPCRRCAKCLQFRQMMWRQRAIHELNSAKRTWVVGLTFSPIHLAGILMEAKGSSIKNIEAAAYPHIQRFLKRLRKGCKAKKIGETIIRNAQPPAVFRYLAVYELGEKHGRSHYHMLIHETGPSPITKITLESHWRSFVHARLARRDEEQKAAKYLTKYTTKDFYIRPRASLGYGKLPFP